MACLRHAPPAQATDPPLFFLLFPPCILSLPPHHQHPRERDITHHMQYQHMGKSQVACLRHLCPIYARTHKGYIPEQLAIGWCHFLRERHVTSWVVAYVKEFQASNTKSSPFGTKGWLRRLQPSDKTS